MEPESVIETKYLTLPMESFPTMQRHFFHGLPFHYVGTNLQKKSYLIVLSPSTKCEASSAAIAV